MAISDELSFGFTKKTPLVLQTEAAECGLACLAMIAGYHGYGVDLATLRRQYPVSLKGTTLNHLIQIASRLQLGTRALKLELSGIDQLKLPCILHWGFNHFVVLKEISAKSVVILDPAFGERRLSIDKISDSFTGVALELWPNTEFKLKEKEKPVKLRHLMGNVSGLGRSFAQVIILALSLEVFAIVSPFFLQWVIDDVIVSENRDLLSLLAIGFLLLMLMQQGISAVRTWVIMYMGTTLNIQWRANVFSHLIRLPVQYFEKRHLGDVLSRFGSIDQIQRTLTTSFLEAILDGVMTIVTLAMMFIYSGLLGWIAVGAMGLYAISRWLWYRPLRNATEEQIIHAAKQQSHFLETIRGVKTIKLFQRQDERRATWLTLLVDQVNADLRTQRMQLLYKLLNGILFGIENVLIIWLGAKLVLNGNFSVGALIAFNSYRSQFDGRVGSLIDKYFELRMLQLQGDRLADIVFSEPETSHASNMLFEDERHESEFSVEAVNVRFRYAEQEALVLDGVSFKISAGESVAIVGPSGCGKTTLMNVLLGILPPTEGDVRIGGESIKQLGVDRLRQAVGTVLQDDVLFAGSIADNISFFDPNADQAWIEECAKMAAISSEITVMPMKYNTLVGDMGTVLSGGQKQRVLLARALYKRPRILFLDEATSHLDIAKELEVNAAIKNLKITRVVIAHRQETVAAADRVISLDNGRISSNELDSQPRLATDRLESVEPESAEEKCVRQDRRTKTGFSEVVRSIPINGNVASDFTAFGRAIGKARVVLLGQQSYGDGNALKLKTKLVQYLHENKGFDILALESGPFDLNCIAEAVDGGSSYLNEAAGSIFYMYACAREMAPLFEYLDAQRKINGGIRLVGFDFQHTGKKSLQFFCSHLHKQLIAEEPVLATGREWENFCALTKAIIQMDQEANPSEEARDSYFKTLDELIFALEKKPKVMMPLAVSPDFWIRLLKILKAQAYRFWKVPMDSEGNFPTKVMADYLLWLINGPLADKKIVIWTTNRDALRQVNAPTVGAFIAKEMGDSVVAVGLTGGAGTFIDSNSREEVGVGSPLRNSLENQLRATGLECGLVDLRDASVLEQIKNVQSWRLSQFQPVNLPLTGSFDLMIYMNEIAPACLNENGASSHSESSQAVVKIA